MARKRAEAQTWQIIQESMAERLPYEDLDKFMQQEKFGTDLHHMAEYDDYYGFTLFED